MQTHDEEIRRFFKHSSVQVLLCPRTAGKRHSWVKQRVSHKQSFSASIFKCLKKLIGDLQAFLVSFRI